MLPTFRLWKRSLGLGSWYDCETLVDSQEHLFYLASAPCPLESDGDPWGRASSRPHEKLEVESREFSLLMTPFVLPSQNIAFIFKSCGSIPNLYFRAELQVLCQGTRPTFLDGQSLPMSRPQLPHLCSTGVGGSDFTYASYFSFDTPSCHLLSKFLTGFGFIP